MGSDIAKPVKPPKYDVEDGDLDPEMTPWIKRREPLRIDRFPNGDFVTGRRLCADGSLHVWIIPERAWRPMPEIFFGTGDQLHDLYVKFASEHPAPIRGDSWRCPRCGTAAPGGAIERMYIPPATERRS